jgi:O-antigen ligase
MPLLFQRVVPGLTPPEATPRLGWFVFGLLVYIVVTWSIPNGLLPFHRNVPLYLCFFGVAWIYFHQRPSASWHLGKPVGWLLAVMVLWALVVEALASRDGWDSLRTLQSYWLRALLLGAFGLFLTPIFSGRNDPALVGRGILACLIAALVALPCAQALDSLWLWFQQGSFPWGESRLAYSRMEMSVHVGMAVTFLATEAALRLVIGRRWLPMTNAILAGMVAICVFAELGLRTRNATIVLGTVVLLLAIALMVYLVRSGSSRRFVQILMVGLSIATLFGVVSYHSDSRWPVFAETVPVALETEKYQAWRDEHTYPPPTLSNGQIVDMSSYLRIAWFKIGLELMLKEPIGQGYSKSNFHQLVERYYGPAESTSQAHSGLINFGLAYGIPGLLIWLALMGALVWHGGRVFYRERRMAGLFLMVFVVSFTLRSLIDDILRDHMREMFFFFTGLLVALTRCGESSERADKSS